MPRWRVLLIALVTVLLGGYLALVALLWAQQDRMVFPGAGRGDRGVPAMARPPQVSWLGSGDERTRIGVVAPAPPATPAAVVVYFGGNGEDLYATTARAAELAEYGVEAWGTEHPGYGLSPGEPSVTSLLAAAERAVDAARARAAALGVPLVVVGNSLGTCCAVHGAARGGVDRLVLCAPPTTMVAAAKARFGWLPVDLLLRHRFDNLAVAAAVRCPTLVLHGDRDGIVPQALGRELAAALPVATFVGVPGAGHNDLDLSVRGPLAAALRPFLTPR